MNHHQSPWVCKSKCLKMVRQIQWSCAGFRCKNSRAREPWPRCLSLFFSAFQEGSTVVGNSKNIHVSLSEGHTHKCIEEVRILCNFREGKYICMWSLDSLSHEVLLFFFSLSSQLCLFLPSLQLSPEATFVVEIRSFRPTQRSCKSNRRPMANVTETMVPRSHHWSSTGRSNTLINGTGWDPRMLSQWVWQWFSGFEAKTFDGVLVGAF